MAHLKGFCVDSDILILVGVSVVCVKTKNTVERFFVWLLHNTKILQIHYRFTGYKNSALLIILLSWDNNVGGEKGGYRMRGLWVDA